jgi:hypothetical protein
MACESIKAALAENESKRNALAARLGPAQNDAQFAFDALQSALRLRTQNLSESFVASYNGREFRGPNAVEDYIAFVQNDFNTKRDIRRDLGLEFNALFPEKERLEKELAECEATPTGPVDSAGQIAAESGQAAAEGAQTQNPQAAPETLNQNGTVVTAPGATTSSNAVQSGADPAVNGVTVSAPSLPNNTSSSAGNVVTTQTSPVTNTSTPASPSNTNSLIGDFGTSSATQSYIYRAVKITHHFKAGKFTQQLNGSLVIYDKLPQNQTVSTLNDPQQQAAARAQAAEDQAAAARAQAALTDPRRVDTAQTPPINDTANPSSPSSETPPANSEPLAPAETAPPTSGNQDISVKPVASDPGLASDPFGLSYFESRVASSERIISEREATEAQLLSQINGDGEFSFRAVRAARDTLRALEADPTANPTAVAAARVNFENISARRSELVNQEQQNSLVLADAREGLIENQRRLDEFKAKQASQPAPSAVTSVPSQNMAKEA